MKNTLRQINEKIPFLHKNPLITHKMDKIRQQFLLCDNDDIDMIVYDDLQQNGLGEYVDDITETLTDFLSDLCRGVCGESLIKLRTATLHGNAAHFALARQKELQAGEYDEDYISESQELYSHR